MKKLTLILFAAVAFAATSNDPAEKDVINAVVKPGRLQRQQIFGLLDDADQSLVAPGDGQTSLAKKP